MKKLLTLLFVLLLVPQLAHAGETISPKHSSLVVSEQKNPTYTDEAFLLKLSPKTSTQKTVQTPNLGDKVYLYAEDEEGNITPYLKINDPEAKALHYLRETTEVKGLYLMSANKLKNTINLKASFSNAGTYTLYATYLSGKTKIETYKIPSLKDSIFVASSEKNRTITIKVPTFDGFMAINPSLLDNRLTTMVIAPPFEESIKRHSLPIDEHGERETNLEILFYDKNARPVARGANVTLEVNTQNVTARLETPFTDDRGSVHLTLSGAVNEGDSLTFYLDDKRVALPLSLKPYSLRPREIIFSYNKHTFLVDGKEMPLTQAMVLKDGRTYLPLRAMSEAINAKSFFEPKAKVISTYYQNHILTMTLNTTSYTIDNQTKTMDAAPFVKNGYTLVPIRFVANEFGYQVSATKAGVTLRLKEG